jgi:dethiobiotin synthetase
MKTIVVSGAHSNIGKTLLAEEIIRSLPGWSALKVTVSRQAGCPRMNSCRICSEFKDDFNIVTDRRIINQKGTDTARLKKAGAKKVAWLRANLKGLKVGLEEAIYYLKDARGIVIEGTSVLRCIKPSLVIYLQDNHKHLRTTARQAQKEADIIIDVHR